MLLLKNKNANKFVFWLSICITLTMKYRFYILIFIICFSAEAQQTDYVDFIKADATIGFNVEEKQVIGLVTYSFNILKNTDSVFIDAKSMNINSVFEAFGESKYVYNNKTIVLQKPFKKGNTYTVTIDYTVKPKKALYFVNKKSSYQIWTQGQGKYTSNWLPSIDDMNDKIEFDLSLFYDNDYVAIANGKQIVKTAHGKDTVVKYNMKQPMSSYLVALAIGKYNKKMERSKSSIPLEFYYYPEDSAKVEPTFRYTKQLFNFLEEEIGVPYPWQNYKQVPVKDFLYSGMENTSLTIFSDDFMIDNTSFVDKNYVNVNAHELAHQWFGNLVTEIKGKHHWLQEGFATYYALLAERDVFGDNYYYWQLYEYAQELFAQDQAGQSTALLNPKASSTTFYKKGAWALHVLKEQVGESAFKIGVKNYLEKYQFKNVETQDFITEVEKASGQDLELFVKDWLLSKKLPYTKMIKHLTSVSSAVSSYLEIDCERYSLKCNELIVSNIFDKTKIKIISQIPNKIDTKDFKNAIKVRQAIAKNLSKIPSKLKANYETLLYDKSYITVEAALYNLWSNFTEDQKKYLDVTSNMQGFNNKNVRLLWLVLALNTENYNDDIKQSYYNELVEYTAPKNGFQLRQNAFEYINSIQAFNKKTINHLIEASKHHNWRFKRFAKQLLETLAKNEKYKTIITTLQDSKK